MAWHSKVKCNGATCMTIPNFVFGRSNRCDLAVYKMAVVRHFGFLKVQKFNGWQGWECHYVPLHQISWRTVKPLPRYGDFRDMAIFDFQNGGRLPS